MERGFHAFWGASMNVGATGVISVLDSAQNFGPERKSLEMYSLE